MNNSLAASVKLVLKSNFDNALDLTTVRDSLSRSWTNTFTDGTGANKAQVAWHDERTLTSGNADTLDLAGALSCAFGIVTFTKVKLIAIQLITATAGYTIEVGGASENQFINWVTAANDEIIIGAGGMFLITAPGAAGFAVTADTGDDLYIDNQNAGSIIYDIVVIGEGSVV